MRRIFGAVCIALVILTIGVCGGLYWYAGMYGFYAILSGSNIWTASGADDPRISPSMKLALGATIPPVEPGNLEWRALRPGFEVGELPAMAEGREVDRILLARVDPSRFRFEVRNNPSGEKNLQDWMKDLGAALVINGSYYSNHGTPDTPFLSNGVKSGPQTYAATHGAFVASSTSIAVRDLSHSSWPAAFDGADNAMVSYPMLMGTDGRSRVTPSNWLANRSFVAEDAQGRIILGTTVDAFFSLQRLAAFLRQAPLQLATALNLDGGPVACQGVSLDGFSRNQCGKFEMRTAGDRLELLRPAFGKWRRTPLPIVLVVFPR